MKRIISILLIVSPLLGCDVLPGPTPGPTSAPRPVTPRSQEFRFNLAGEPPGLDPQYASWDTSISVLAQLFEGLLRFDDSLRPAPALAREVPTVANGGISPDGFIYTFL